VGSCPRREWAPEPRGRVLDRLRWEWIMEIGLDRANI
jgi:hypothetical protein